MALTQQFTAGSAPTAQKLNESSIPVVSSTVDISAPFTGQIIFNTTDTRMYRYTGSAWVVFTGGPTWSLSRTTGQPIPTSAWTTMAWTLESVDLGNQHAANAAEIVITQPGLLAISTKVSFAANAAGQRAGRVTLNGTADANTIRGSATLTNATGGGHATGLTLPTLYQQVVTGDVLRVQCWQNGAASLDTGSSIGDEPLFNGTWLRD